MIRRLVISIVIAAVATFAHAQAFEYVCTIDTVGIIGTDPATMEVRAYGAGRDLAQLAVKDTYLVTPSGVREQGPISYGPTGGASHKVQT